MKFSFPVTPFSPKIASCLAALALVSLVAEAPAFAWDPAVPISSAATNAYSAKMVMNGKGRIAIVWSYFDGAIWHLASSVKSPGGQFGIATPFTSNFASVGGWDVEASKKGRITAIWGSDDGVDKVIQSSDLLPDESLFGASTQISLAGPDKTFPQLGVDKKGNMIAVWANWMAPGLEASMRPAKEAFGTPQAFASDQTVESLLFEMSPVGQAVAVWRADVAAPEDQIQASVRLPGGQFDPFQVVSQPAINSTNPSMTIGPKGGSTVFWEGNGTEGAADLEPGGNLFGAGYQAFVYYGSVFRYDKAGNLYAFATRSAFDHTEAVLRVRPAGSTVFEPNIVFNETGLSSFAGGITVDKKGNVRVTWTQGTADGHYYVRTSYQPAGGGFGAPEDLTPVDGYNAAYSLVADKAGNATSLFVKTVGGISQLFASYRPRG